MTDKVQKIREEVARIQLYTQSEVLKQVLDYIDEVQKEPESDRLAFKAIPRLLEMIEPTDRAKLYTAKLADALEVEGYSTDAKIVRESLKIMNGEKVPMATMDGEPVSEKKCIFTKDSYTDEDRKVLCEDCKEKCEYSKKEEPVSEDLKEFEVKYFEREKDEIICVYDRHVGLVDGAQWQKEQFEKNRLAACDAQTEEEAEIERDFVMGIIEKEHRQPTFDDAIKYGMRLQRENMTKEAIDVEVKVDAGGYPYIDKTIELYDYDKDIPLAKVGDEYKVVLIKED